MAKYTGYSYDEVCYTCKWYNDGWCGYNRVYEDDSCRDWRPGENYGGSSSCLFVNLYGEGSPEVVFLRNYRDVRLKNNVIGKAIILLYRHFSPPMSKLVKQNKAFRRLFRVLLDPLIKCLSTKKEDQRSRCSGCPFCREADYGAE